MNCFYCDDKTTKIEEEELDGKGNSKYTRLTKLLCGNCGAFFHVYLPKDKAFFKDLEIEED